MFKTLWAVARKDKIELLENVNIPDGTKVLVTIFPQNNEAEFWLSASQSSIDSIWNNEEDDVYAQLLEK